ncbi:MAG TPA: choice-of-anchor D domain-containing protein, partial [Thiotrichaceae bacterium]|nr:choice-of-anchor D domain-containing protein [Thiotrichaceae bacterium]
MISYLKKHPPTKRARNGGPPTARQRTLARAIAMALLGTSSLGATGAMAAEPDFFAGDSYSLILRDDGALFQLGGNPDVPRIELPEPFTFSLSNEAVFTGVDSIVSNANSLSNAYAAVSIDKEALVWCPSEKCVNEITVSPTPITGSHISDLKDIRATPTDYLIDNGSDPIYFGGWDGEKYTINQINKANFPSEWENDLAVIDAGLVFSRQREWIPNSQEEKYHILPISGLKDVKKALGSDYDGIALTNTGTVFGWRHDWENNLRKVTQIDGVTDVKEIYGHYSNGNAITNSGVLFAWYYDWKTKQHVVTQIATFVKELHNGAAVKNDGSVIAWYWHYSNRQFYVATVATDLKELGNSVAIKTDGNLVGWNWGWNATQPSIYQISTDVRSFIGNGLALKTDNNVITWNGSSVAQIANLADIDEIVEDGNGNNIGLVVKTNDGGVVAWNYYYRRGYAIGHFTDLVDVKEFGDGSGYQGAAIYTDARTVFAWLSNGSTYSFGKVNGLIDIKETLPGSNYDYGIAITHSNEVYSWQWDANANQHKIQQLLTNRKESIGYTHASAGLFASTDGRVIVWQWNSNTKEYVVKQVLANDSQIKNSSYYSQGAGVNNAGELVAWQWASRTHQFVITTISTDFKEFVENNEQYNSIDLAVTNNGALVSWRWDNTNSQFVITPELLTNFKAFEQSGYRSGFALTNSGEVFALKNDGSTGYTVTKVDSLTDVVEISSSESEYQQTGHTLALKGDGTLCGWGNNLYGQLGKGHPDTVPITAPVCHIEDFTVYDQTGCDLQFEAVDFGASAANSTQSLKQAIAISSESCESFKGPLQITDSNIFGSNANEFQVNIGNQECYGGTMNDIAYSTCWFKMDFSPTSEGAKDAKLSFTFNDTALNMSPISLHGEAIQSGQADIEVSPDTYHFSASLNEHSGTQIFTAQNDGNVNLKLGDIGVDGTNAGDFRAYDHQCAYTNVLKPSELCKLSAQFAPQTEGDKQANLVINSNDANDPALHIPLTGTVVTSSSDYCSDTSLTTIETSDLAKEIPDKEPPPWLWPNTWTRVREVSGDNVNKPTEYDVVRIKEGHSITGIRSAKIKALCIESGATLTSLNDQGTQLYIQAAEHIENQGLISGKAGAPEKANCIEGGHYPSNVGMQDCAQQGASIYLRVTEGMFRSLGKIVAGKGGDGIRYAGSGGSVSLSATNVIHAPQSMINYPIRGGKGGDITGTQSGHAGRGGSTSLWGSQSVATTSHSAIYSGNGGNCNPAATEAQIGGDGGRQWLNARGSVDLQGIFEVGNGGTQCTPLGRNGRDGNFNADPGVLTISGKDTKISAGDIKLYGGENWTLDLSGLSDNAITATGDITLAIGKGGIIDLRGNANNVLKAEGGVQVFSDKLMLDEDTKLSELVEAKKIIAGPSKILRDVSLTAPVKLSGEPEVTLPVTVTLINASPEKDTFSLTVSDSASWVLAGLPEQIEIDALGAVELKLSVTLPKTLGLTDTITVTATSQADSEVKSEAKVQVIVAEEEIVLPPTLGNYTASGTILDINGNPIAGVTVKIGDITVITNETGYWEINGLAEGEYTVIASKAGYRFDSKPCVVSDNEKGCQPVLPAESVLDIKVVPEPRIAKQGENVTYSITVTNQGEETATSVTLADVLPDNTDLVTIESLEGGP